MLVGNTGTGTGVLVGGTGVLVGRTAVGVAVAGIGVGSDVLVGGTGVDVLAGVDVGGTAVEVGGGEGVLVGGIALEAAVGVVRSLLRTGAASDDSPLALATNPLRDCGEQLVAMMTNTTKVIIAIPTRVRRPDCSTTVRFPPFEPSCTLMCTPPKLNTQRVRPQSNNVGKYGRYGDGRGPSEQPLRVLFCQRGLWESPRPGMRRPAGTMKETRRCALLVGR